MADSKGCLRCADLRDNTSKDRNIIVLPGDIKDIKPKVSVFVKYVNVLMNEAGGLIFIHAEDPHDLGEFDKVVDDKLVELIPDETLFTSWFERRLVDPTHLRFRVKPKHHDRPLSTYDFRSTTSLDRGKKKLTHGQFRRFLKDVFGKPLPPTDEHDDAPLFKQDAEVMHDGDICFQECAWYQAKDADIFRDENTSVEKIRQKIWEGLCLSHYIAGFTKIPAGGSIFFGVEEKKKEKKFYCNGIQLTKDNCKELGSMLGKNIRLSLLWAGQHDGNVPEDVASICFHEVSEGCYVLEIKVLYFHGICFEIRKGPVAYIWADSTETKETPVIFKKWADTYMCRVAKEVEVAAQEYPGENMKQNNNCSERFHFRHDKTYSSKSEFTTLREKHYKTGVAFKIIHQKQNELQEREEEQKNKHCREQTADAPEGQSEQQEQSEQKGHIEHGPYRQEGINQEQEEMEIEIPSQHAEKSAQRRHEQARLMEQGPPRQNETSQMNKSWDANPKHSDNLSARIENDEH